jgi:hypothetical protein
MTLSTDGSKVQADASGCLASAAKSMRDGLTAFYQGQWVNAYTLGQLQ